MIPASSNLIESRESVATSLRTFMRLPVAQRSSVILRDVLGYSVEEVRDVMDSSIPQPSRPCNEVAHVCDSWRRNLKTLLHLC